MIELRPIGGLIFGLNICILIWRISVQEPALIEAEAAAHGYGGISSGGGGGGIINFGTTNLEYYDKNPELNSNNIDSNNFKKLTNFNAIENANSNSYLKFNSKHEYQMEPQLSYLSKHLLSENTNDDNNKIINENENDNINTNTNANNIETLLTNNIYINNNENEIDIKNNNNNNNNIDLNLVNLNLMKNQNYKTSHQLILNHLNSTSTTTTSRRTATPKRALTRRRTVDINKLIQFKNINNNNDYNKKTLDLRTSSSNSSNQTKLLNFPKKFNKETIFAKNITAPQPNFIPKTPKYMPPTLTTRPMTTTAASPTINPKDYHQLIDLNDFEFHLQQPSCSSEIKALILVHSAPMNFEKRRLIRETWASKDFLSQTPFRMIFLLGAVGNASLQATLYNEYSQYKDLIQGSFYDDYYNMTYKHVMAFKWFLYKCPTADLLIKVDDDVFVNTPKLYNSFLKHKQQQQQRHEQQHSLIFRNISSIEYLLFDRPKNLLFCEKVVGAKVKRTYRSKWRVSFKDYRKRYYPPYCPGYAIIYSKDVVISLYEAAQQHSYFWIDDVHITGILAQDVNLNITNSKDYVLFETGCHQLLSRKTDYNQFEFIFAWYQITAKEIRQFWQFYREQNASLPPIQSPLPPPPQPPPPRSSSISASSSSSSSLML